MKVDEGYGDKTSSKLKVLEHVERALDVSDSGVLQTDTISPLYASHRECEGSAPRFIGLRDE